MLEPIFKIRSCQWGNIVNCKFCQWHPKLGLLMHDKDPKSFEEAVKIVLHYQCTSKDQSTTIFQKMQGI